MPSGYATIKIHSTDFVSFDHIKVDMIERISTDTSYVVVVEAGCTIEAALKKQAIKLTQAAVALVNGMTQDLSYVLAADDQVELLFQISGG